MATFYCEHIFIVNIFGETFYRLSRIIWLYNVDVAIFSLVPFCSVVVIRCYRVCCNFCSAVVALVQCESAEHCQVFLL